MKITKYEHACLLLEKNSTKLVIDPGSFTKLPTDIVDIHYVIVTEEHYDHFSLQNLQQIVKQSPEAKIFTTKAVHDELTQLGMNAQSVSGNSEVIMGDFTVNFYETDHAVIYKDSPCKSLAIKIDEYLYYPSDTYRTIDQKITVLALPTSGPWFKVSESIDFANAIDSDVILVTHDGINSPGGNVVTNNFIKPHIDTSRQFVFLEIGETFEP